MNFQIETSSFCDLTCRECPNVDMARKRKFMSLETFERILRSYVLPYKHMNSTCPPTVIPHKDGEPLLNKGLPQMLGMVAEADPSLKIDIYSHGLLLPRKPEFVPFLGSLPNRVRLMVSFHFHNHDGSTNDYGAFTSYMKQLLDRGELPGNVELIFVSHLIAPSTQAFLDEWKASWQPYVRYGCLAAVHTNAAINPWTGRMEDVATCRYDGCPYGDFGHMFFGAGGEVVACCMDLDHEIVFGSCFDDPAEIVAKLDAFYAEQRRIHAAKERVTHPVCANCFGQCRKGLIDIGVKV